MLDAFIIDHLRKKERLRKEEEKRPRLEIPPPLPIRKDRRKERRSPVPTNTDLAVLTIPF